MVSYGNDPRSLFGRVTGNIHREKVVNSIVSHGWNIEQNVLQVTSIEKR